MRNQCPEISFSEESDKENVSSFNNSTPKPPKTIEEENEDVLALLIIENPKPVSLLTDYNHSSTVSDNVLQSSLSDTATLIHNSDLILF